MAAFQQCIETQIASGSSRL